MGLSLITQQAGGAAHVVLLKHLFRALCAPDSEQAPRAPGGEARGTLGDSAAAQAVFGGACCSPFINVGASNP